MIAQEMNRDIMLMKIIVMNSFLLGYDTVLLSKWFLVNKTNLVHNFSWYVNFFSLHVLGDYVTIIRRNNCIYTTLCTCYSVWMTVWCVGWNENCVPSWLYLQDYTRTHGQQNIKKEKWFVMFISIILSSPSG